MAYQYRIEGDSHCIVDVGDVPVDNVTTFRLFSEARDALADHYRHRRDAYRSKVRSALNISFDDVIAEEPAGSYTGEYNATY